MRARLLGILATSAALIVSAPVTETASADPATWTVVSADGAFSVTGGEMVLTVEETNIQFVCYSSGGDATTRSGLGLPNPLATFPESIGIRFTNCQWAFAMPFEIEPVGDWTLNGVSFDGSDVTTATLDGVAANLLGMSCVASVAGSLNVRYTNSTSVLEVLPDFTLEVTYVNPAIPCLGLINEGEHLSLHGDFFVSPWLAITSP